MLDQVMDNLPIALGVTVGLIGIIVFLAFQRRARVAQEKMKRCAPLVTFLKEISRSDLDERRLKVLFDPRIFQEVEYATVKTMCRCISESLGSFVKMQPGSASLSVKKDAKGTANDSNTEAGYRFHASAVCEFAKCNNVRCDVAWRTAGGSTTAHVISFSVKPSGKELDVFEHIKPADFESFGEKFIGRLLSKTPKSAVDLMCAPLAAKFGDASKVTEEMRRVVVAMGGFKDKQLDIGFSDSRRVKLGAHEHQRSAIELDYVILGNTRDVRVTVCLIFAGVKTQVLRYSFTALPVKQKLAFVDEHGQPVVA